VGGWYGGQGWENFDNEKQNGQRSAAKKD